MGLEFMEGRDDPLSSLDDGFLHRHRSMYAVEFVV